jgi:argininosuccinate lyase
MDPLFARFNASISFDKRLFEEDVQGSIAHARMLGSKGIISAREALTIETALKMVLEDFRKGRFQFSEELEDVHINIEEALKKKIGELAGKLHTARSRNDQVALDLRLYLRSQIRVLSADLLSLMKALVDKAEANVDVIFPGYTHLQRAQPVRLAHHLMAYFQMFQRDWKRFQDSLSRMDEMPLGAAALAGTTFPIDRKRVAEELGFSRISANSMDAVSDRDFALDFLFNSSVAMMHLSRLAEELVVWSSSEFGFCTLPDAFCSGSSIMPQKKNPDACELIRGKTGRVYGNLMALLTTLKALPLTYNKDLQEDKEPVFDAVDTLEGSLKIMASLIPGIEFHTARLMEAASDSSLAATDLADKLVKQGMAFRDAHSQVGAVIRQQAPREEFEKMLTAHVRGVRGRKRYQRREKPTEEAERLPTPEEMVEARRHEGGTARQCVMDQIRQAKAFLRGKDKTGRVTKTGRNARGGRSKA